MRLSVRGTFFFFHNNNDDDVEAKISSRKNNSSADDADNYCVSAIYISEFKFKLLFIII